MWTYVFSFALSAIIGFAFGKKAHRQQLSKILLRQGMPMDQVERLDEIIRNYNKLNRQAKKETREAYKKFLVDSSLEKMKKGGAE